MNDLVSHAIEQAGDIIIIEPAVRLAVGIFTDRAVQVIGKSRVETIEKVWTRAKERLGGKPIEAPPLSISVPLLQAAQDEAREELIELWASLLAAACDPEKRKHYRREFVDVVKKLEPLDAVVLSELDESGGMSPNRVTFLAGKLGASHSQVELSIRNLLNLELIWQQTPNTTPQSYPITVTFGKELLRLVGHQNRSQSA
jgi:hypothetical protein